VKKIILDATNKTLEVVLDVTPSLGLQYTTTWADATATALTEGSSDGTIPTTAPVTIVAAPASGTRRAIIDFSVYNPNSNLVAGSLIYRQGINGRIITRFRLSPDEILTTGGVFSSSGRLRVDSGLGEREILTATRIYYARPDGSDGNNGLSNFPGGAFLTVQKLIDTAAQLDFSTFDVIGQIGDGTYSGSVALRSFIGSGKFILQGNSSSPGSVAITSSAAGDGIAGTISASGVQGRYALRDFSVAAPGAARNGLSVGNNSTVEYQNLDFGAASGAQMLSYDAGAIACTGNYTISGGAAAHYWSNATGIIRCQGKTISFLGNANYSRAFALSDYYGILTANANIYSLGAFAITGKRFQAEYGGLIITAGGGANYFPGDVAGTPVPAATEAQIHSAFYGQYT
jgi:hypothetical protein